MNNVLPISDAIVRAVRERERLDVDSVPLSAFRDAYNRLIDDNVFWVLVLVEDQIVVQPLGRDEIVIVINDGTKFYHQGDLAFLSSENSWTGGTTEGPYRFQQFLCEIFGVRGIIASLILLAGLGTFFYYIVKAPVIEKLADSLIASLSIFITIFVLFALSFNPETEYRFAETNRLHRLMKTDAYIARISVVSLVLAIVTSALCAGFPEEFRPMYPFWIRVLQVAPLTGAVLGTLTSFWLVVNYHFQRRNELTAMQMAKCILRSKQELFERRMNEVDDHSAAGD